MKSFKQIITESQELITPESVKVVASYLASKIDTTKYKKQESKNSISFFRSMQDGGEEYFSIEYYTATQQPTIFLNLYILRYIKGESLADPAKAYQTTSAHYFKKKKYEVRNMYESIETANKAIDKFLAKIK